MQFRSNEQASFSKLVTAHMQKPDAPLLLEGGTGLGKTRAYLFAVAQSDKRVAICLPSHQLIDQLLSSSDLEACGLEVVAFRPARWFESRAEYIAQKERAMAARVMVCTSASVIIDQRLQGDYCGVVDRDYIIFDEADQLPGVAALQSDCSIPSSEFKATTAEAAAREMLNKRTPIEPEVRAAALMILECLDRPDWFWTTGMTDDGDAALFHRLPGRLLKRIANCKNVAFISATLTIGGQFNDFKSALGISEHSRLSTCIEPERHGSLTFSVNPLDVNADDWVDEVKAALLDAPRPCLVITPSHTLSEQLAIDDCTVRHRDETTTEAVQRDTTGLVVAAGAWAGLDTPIQWASIVIPRVPFAAVVSLDGHIESSYINTRNAAIRRLRQGIGRGLRKPDAECRIVVMDSRAQRLGQFVPSRFVAEWKSSLKEGGRREVTLSQSERSSYYRKLALKHYGKQCQSCDFVPINDRQLHVHHLHPLCEGERQTTMDDLAVLCANCHSLAHSENPPLPVEALRSLTEVA